jgi:rare lipoprotein A
VLQQELKMKLLFCNKETALKKHTFALLLVLRFVSNAFAQDGTTKTETGLASFYADKFNGRRTASGEVFYQDSLTAAHKTLPFGSRIRVTNLVNGKSVVVKVNDRGMKGTKRIVDLSNAAAREIGSVAAGIAKVRVEVLP